MLFLFLSKQSSAIGRQETGQVGYIVQSKVAVKSQHFSVVIFFVYTLANHFLL